MPATQNENVKIATVMVKFFKLGYSWKSKKEKDIQLKLQLIFDHLQSSSEMEPPSSKGDLDGLNDRHKKLNQLLEPKKYNFETDIQVLENLERSSTDMESLLTEVCSFNAFDAKLSIADSQIEAFTGKLLPVMEYIQELVDQMTQKYFCFEEIMPSEVFRKIGDLESFSENIRVKIEEKESEARQGRAVRGEYLLGVESFQSWMQTTENRMREKSLQPSSLIEFLNELKLDLVSVTKEVDTINKCVQVIRQKSKNEEYLENISVTMISLTHQIKTIKSWLEENKLQYVIIKLQYLPVNCDLFLVLELIPALAGIWIIWIIIQTNNLV
ncbi:uncharacterized protein LOC136041873 [Artemia franciscana]|uniref:uncharacterized protein LOC136041873 n=1 Tax=Artemia franciscana TaxID=6661 RepID=UPI0032DB04F3